MNTYSKILLAATLALTAAANVGCSSSDKAATTDGAQKDDTQQVQRAAFSSALIAEDRLKGIFESQDGLVGDKAVSYFTSKRTEDEAVAFLSALSWDKEVAKKEYEAVLGDKALLDTANKAFEAKAKADGKSFKPVAAVAVSDKLGANSIKGAKFEDAKIEGKDSKYTVEYKGLKYTLEKKDDNSFKVVGKEGTLQK